MMYETHIYDWDGFLVNSVDGGPFTIDSNIRDTIPMSFALAYTTTVTSWRDTCWPKIISSSFAVNTYLRIPFYVQENNTEQSL